MEHGEFGDRRMKELIPRSSKLSILTVHISEILNIINDAQIDYS